MLQVSADSTQRDTFSTRVLDFGDPALIPELRKQHVAISVSDAIAMDVGAREHPLAHAGFPGCGAGRRPRQTSARREGTIGVRRVYASDAWHEDLSRVSSRSRTKSKVRPSTKAMSGRAFSALAVGWAARKVF
jgi:hypothetical protein